MSYSATIKFAPILTVERLNDPRWTRRGRKMYDPGSLQFPPSKTRSRCSSTTTKP